MSAYYNDLINNLRHGFGFALFRRGRISDFHVGIEQAIGLIMLSLLVEVVSDYLLSLPYPGFEAGALPVFSLSLVLFSFAAYLFARLLKRRMAALQLLVVAYSATFLFYLIEFITELAIPSAMELEATWWIGLLGVQSLWLLLVLLRVTYVVAEGDMKSTAAGAVILSSVWLAPMIIGGWDQTFWYPDAPVQSENDPYAEYRKMDGEAVMYAQPERLQEVLAGLEPGRAGVTDLYFVGVAGYAYQDVFAKEVRYARDLMDEHYGTQGRSLLFVNHLQSHNDLPLASATNLERTLKHLATVMQPEEDVVMIYLTSHGSQKHELALEFWPLPLNDLTPERLRRMLDDAGIQWRIVVVSACYSGGFVEPLRDEHTLVATAAAPDKKSFGCSNENDFTYFGEALFKDELNRNGSLLEAFRHAPARIAQREETEKLEPSLPQLHIGSMMEEKLGGMQYRQCLGANTEEVAAGC